MAPARAVAGRFPPCETDGMFRSEDEDHPVPGEWIVNRILTLLRDLRQEDPRFRELKPRNLLDPAAVYEPAARGDFDAAVAAVAAKYGLEPGRVRLVWLLEMSPRTAAHVHCEPGGAVEIAIRECYQRDPEGFGTVIAHELGHAYLTDLGIENGGSWEAEATTDLVTMVKGLGKLTVNGVSHLFYGETAGSRCYGYLNREANVFAYARTCQQLGVPPAEVRSGLNPAALSYLRTLTEEPGPPGCLLGGLLGFLRRRPKPISEMDLAVDEHGNIVERP